MLAKVTWNSVLLVAALFLGLAGVRHVSAQLEGLEGMEPPDDVTGQDCTMCHGTFAQDFKFSHEPAFSGKCIGCHIETTPHGALISQGRELCESCHTDRAGHYPAATCWSAGCHADMHGSDADKLLIPTRAKEYPGFAEATAGAEYVGSAVCLSCHTGQCSWWQVSAHGLSDADENTPLNRRGCESCHGPGGNHYGDWTQIGDFTQASREETDGVCLTCHSDETFVPDYEKSIHVAEGVACTSCHNPHDAEFPHNLRLNPNQVCLDCHPTVRVDFAKTSHHPVDFEDPRTGILCIECHNPHGGEGTAMLVAPAEDLCATCHVNKAGPFVYSHAGYEPGLGNGCFTCHNPHGSNTPDLLKLTGRGLCLQCHSDRGDHFANQTCYAAGCHIDHHGSNDNWAFIR